ncbi:MAG TPA: 1-(5-phosphoribosyl)-5-[(5-phosphoribosylamino)methylideneamino]imidazole-4-carboxamide isomerase [Candidatus Binatia bacterium]|nr:1-(5-phosphoribosyl)-5-[(5-phosphoribosylamino)methylideneamino]imidazole-4-carboxamide isomerase [Candidatus Binatia bacterium]
MIVYPAIDLRAGRCVRLWQGEYARETVYRDDPVAVARGFAAAGARWLHVVDLDGARAGRPVQTDLVRAICAAAGVPVQVGGGLRDAAAVETVLAAGAARVVLGTVAIREPELARTICRAHPDRVAVGLDTRDGRVRVSGWTEGSTATAPELAAAATDWGAAAIIYTDIGRDGTEHGPDLDGTRAVARAGRVPVIASGGVGSLADIRAVAALAPDGVAGVIVGRALYTGAVELGAALAAAA